MWRLTDPKQLLIGAVIYVVGATGWIINAVARPSVLNWILAIIWLVGAGAYLVRLIRVRQVGSHNTSRRPGIASRHE
jgi:hypothetical protein